MAAFLVRRTLTALLVVAVVLTLSFFSLHLAPGDPSTMYLDARMSEGQQEELRRALGLDRPVVERYGRWLYSVVLERDLGFSFVHNRPVTRVLLERLPTTLLLAAVALLIQFGVGIGLGTLAARREGGLTDRLIRAASLLLYSTPHFWLGLMALLLLSYGLGWFPAGHASSVGSEHWSHAHRFLDLLHHLALPALVLGLALAGGVTRYVRSAMVEVNRQDFMRSSRAAGIRERRVQWLLGLKNGLAPVVQIAGLSLPYLMSGALVTEVVFSWPGMGLLTYNAILSRDYPVVLGATLLTATLVVVGNLLADIGHAAADPRVRKRLLENVA